jgi:hypothetical protein
LVSPERLKFVFDECLSGKIAETLTHCGDTVNPRVQISNLTKEERLRADPHWVSERIRKGFVPVSSDRKMLNEHDIARIVKGLGGKMLLLDARVSQQKRWKLLLWFVQHWPKVALAVDSAGAGSTWVVYADGRLSVVSVNPNIPLPI